MDAMAGDRRTFSRSAETLAETLTPFAHTAAFIDYPEKKISGAQERHAAALGDNWLLNPESDVGEPTQAPQDGAPASEPAIGEPTQAAPASGSAIGAPTPSPSDRCPEKDMEKEEEKRK